MEESASSLDGVRVLELGGGIAVPYATRLLADLGADVVKVEDPCEPDPLRSHDGGVGSVEGMSGLFLYLNAGKRGVAAELSAGAPLLPRLMAWADVVVEGLGPGRLEALGLGPAEVADGGRGSVLVRVSPFGQTGPDREVPVTGLTLQARAGWVSARAPDEPPVQVGGNLHDYVGGVYAASAALTGLRAAQRTDELVVADVSLLECVHSTLPYPTLYRETLRELGRGEVGQRRPLGVERCNDGWVGINILTGQQWQDACALFEVPDYADRWLELKVGGEHLASFRERVQRWLDERNSEEIVTLCQAFRIPATPVGDGASMPEFEQWRNRHFFSRDASPQGVFLHPGFPWRLSATPPRVRRLAPAPGEHDPEAVMLDD